jgi:uncharacterized protein
MSFNTAEHAPGIYVHEQPPGSMPIQGVGTAVAGFVGRTATRPANGAPAVKITNWTQFATKFGVDRKGRFNPFVPGTYLPYAVYGYFANGGSVCYVASVGTPAPPQQLTAGDQTSRQLSLTAADDSPALEVEPTASAGDQPLSIDVADDEQDEDAFTLTIKRGDQVVGEYPGLSVKALKTPTGLNALAAAPVTVTNVIARPKSGHYEFPAPEAPPAPAATSVPAKAFLGSDDGSGLAALALIDEVTMLVAPDAVAPDVSDDEVKAVQDAMVQQCTDLHDRMAILDPPSGLDGQAVADWRDRGLGASEFATLYYPWVRVYDPDADGPRLIPPSGHIAGIWSRSDHTRGVWKAPANEEVSGVLGLERQLSDNDQVDLNNHGVNAIRAFRGRGIRVWGARTLNTDQWIYLNVRRLFNYVEESIKDGTAWAVFEPNEEQLWQRLRRTINAFLLGLWRDGALVGAKPEQAFYVKCDAETNPDDLQDKGVVTIEVGIAPAKPAEFVVFNIQQYKSGSALVGE